MTKRGKKETALEIARLEKELNDRQSKELEELSEKDLPQGINTVTELMESVTVAESTQPQTRVSKAQKRRITPDGNCLYSAIADQLSRQNQQTDMQTLRRLAAEFMLNHEEDFLPFLTDTVTGDTYTSDQYVQYCEELASTAAWGGQLEIQALSQALKIPMEVYQANAPVLRTGEEYDCQPILLSYHHHAYGLGEHYNSVIPLENSLET